MLVLGTFILFGHRWAIVTTMLVWTYEKGYMIFTNPSKTRVKAALIGQIIWWAFYMRTFYLALRIENERKRRQPLLQQLKPVRTPKQIINAFFSLFTKKDIVTGCPNCGTMLLPKRSGVMLCTCGWVGAQSEKSLLSNFWFWGAIASVFLVSLAIMTNWYAFFPDQPAAEALFAKAKDLVYQEHELEAISELSKAIGLSPRRADLRIYLSDLLFNNSRPYSGLNELREAANLASTDYETQESYADALKEYGNKEDALEQFEKSREIFLINMSAVSKQLRCVKRRAKMRERASYGKR